MERSEKILQGLGNQYYRATLKSMGFTTEDLKRPVIGIANAWSECVPGHYNLRQVAQRVKASTGPEAPPLSLASSAAATAWARAMTGCTTSFPPGS